MKKIVIGFIAVPIIIIAAGVSLTMYTQHKEKKMPAGIDGMEHNESTVSIRIKRESAFRDIPYDQQVTMLNF